MNQLARRRFLPALLLSVLGLLTYLPALGDGLVARQQELRVILTARDMAHGGDWIVPHFMGEERLRKPPLMYWVTALSMKALAPAGESFPSRLPAALSGVALLVITWAGGRSLVGRRAAWFGAIALATTTGLLRHARLAETDIVQTLMAATATLCAFKSLQRDAPWHWCAAAGVAAGLGALTKGPAPVAVPMAAIALYAFTVRRTILPLRLVALVAITAICVAGIVLPWYAAVGIRTAAAGLQVASEASLLLTESRHPGPPYYYVYTLPARLGLWAIPFGIALPLAWQFRKHGGMRMLLAWLASSFVMLSCISSKQPHYALLLLPPACLLAGLSIDRALRGMKQKTSCIVRGTLVGSATVVAIAALAGLGYEFCGDAGGILSGLWPVLTALAFICGAALLCPRRAMASFLALTASFGIGTIAHAASVEVRLDEDAMVRTFLRAHRAEIAAAPSFVVAGPHSAMATFYSERPFAPRAGWTNAPAGSLLLLSSRKDRPLEDPPTTGRVAESVARGVHIALFRKAPGATP